MTRAGLFAFLLRLAMASGLWVLSVPPAQAAYSCTVTASNTSMVIDLGISWWIFPQIPTQTITASATLTCTRSPSDPNTLSYRLKATDGLNSDGQQPFRRLRSGGNTFLLDYALQRGASCSNTNTTNWRAPSTGTSNVETGTLNFGGSMVASTSLSYCIRINGETSLSLTAGQYTDTFEIFAQYPNSNTGDISPGVAVSINAGVGEQCVFHTYPGSLVFNYTAFSPSAQTASTAFVLRCNSSLPWSVSVSPATATLLGLRYQIAATPASGTGNGNTGQGVTLTGTMPAGQAGTCTGAVCTDSQPHTVIITY